ncbi:hypothetical protein Thimo_0578 [Thioflavicoccus mobilis 8321]|uniref:DUF427 domain-containing protein n=1 Tax=Thioflavicoccus mobilis 8321 TaxID=765912 RepID=L0GTV8_9GAMM|nr:DUF427 domain-containing protein [Thioflavicoccus mobilis]AGA89426.1 hypothetical protein Thimo_0578 [Thioflavicoccus mobilis 8321]
MRPTQSDLERARRAWTYRGQVRPAFAVSPGPGQESVWDYPRPPAFVPDGRTVEVYAGDILVAHTERAIRALETGSPPAFYLPPEALDRDRLVASERRTFCEWKGEAEYFHVLGDQRRIDDALWRYRDATGAAAVIAGWFSGYPVLLRCLVDGERVRAQAGGYYGGWITDEIVGPFKGEPGTGHW